MKQEITVVKVSTRCQLRTFITYPERLYKNCDNWVPALIGDEFETLRKDKNPAFEFCDADYFLAYRDGKVVGRVAAIINHNANRTWDCKVVRFGWLDFVDDADVLKALLSEVEKWGAERGCDTMKGPLGFTDMDKEGSLVEGYENLSSFTCLYNYPYYDTRLKEYGLEKDADWLQDWVEISPQLPEVLKYAELVEKRFGLRVYQARSMKELGDKYGKALFHTLNEAFAPLYQFTKLSEKQIDAYVKSYLGILNKDFVCILVDREDKAVGFAVCVPSLSKAIKKARGRLFPFGFFPILKALNSNDTIEALMIGVLPEYQRMGASALIFKYLHENAIKYGIKRMVMNPQLETNLKVQTLFDVYKPKPYTRRRSYSKKI